MGYDNGIHVSEAECVEFTNLAIERAENSNGNIIDHLKLLLHPHPESWYHAALELGFKGRANDAIDCWQEYAEQGRNFDPHNNENHSQNLIHGAECIQDLKVRFQFLDAENIDDLSMKFVQQANKLNVSRRGLQYEIELLEKRNPDPREILNKIENYLTTSLEESIETRIFGRLKEIHYSDTNEFSLQSIIYDYIEIGCLSDAFKLWCKINKDNDPSDLIIQLLWYCTNNGIEIEKSINESSVFLDDEEIENIEELKLQKEEAENKLKEKTQQLEEIQKQLEALKGYISNLMNFTK